MGWRAWHRYVDIKFGRLLAGHLAEASLFREALRRLETVTVVFDGFLGCQVLLSLLNEIICVNGTLVAAKALLL